MDRRRRKRPRMQIIWHFCFAGTQRLLLARPSSSQTNKTVGKQDASHQYSSVVVTTMIAVIGSVLALSALSYTDASGTTSRLQVQVSETMFVVESPWSVLPPRRGPSNIRTSYLCSFCTEAWNESIPEVQKRKALHSSLFSW